MRRPSNGYSQRIVNHGLVPGAAARGALADGVVDQRGLPLAVGVVLPVIRLLRRRVGNLRLNSVEILSVIQLSHSVR